MSNIEILSKRIDGEISSVRTALGMGMYPVARNCLQGVGSLIDEYRAEVAKEIEGLKGDVKSAEAAYEREKVRADGLAQEQDRWTNEQLPGWRKRVTDAERALTSMAGDCRSLKAQAEAREAKLEKAIEERDEWRKAYLGSEPASPEGDKTVITFECCNVKHTFSPPKSMQWSHAAECHECGAKTTINS